ncbi:unnamed protein product [Effrenium voratum]|uniref:Uncharacterized protein n=1 Tax=Effrenium voratum TaxID=2562239 RepID=A0AA36HVB3_9DINO|nr:unnamed protein product [Effrenium voratum]
MFHLISLTSLFNMHALLLSLVCGAAAAASCEGDLESLLQRPKAISLQQSLQHAPDYMQDLIKSRDDEKRVPKHPRDCVLLGSSSMLCVLWVLVVVAAVWDICARGCAKGVKLGASCLVLALNVVAARFGAGVCLGTCFGASALALVGCLKELFMAQNQKECPKEECPKEECQKDFTDQKDQKKEATGFGAKIVWVVSGFLALEAAGLLSMQSGLIFFAWVLSLVAGSAAVLMCHVVLEGYEVPHVFWASLTGHVVLPLALVLAYAESQPHVGAPLLHCVTKAHHDGFLSMRYSAMAAMGQGFFIWLLWLCYTVAGWWQGGNSFCRVAFLGLVLLLLSPSMSSLTGRDIFYGPWAMFGGDHDGWQCSPSGYVVFALAAAAVVLMIFKGGRAVKSLEWGRGAAETREAHSLALVRIWAVYWLFGHVNWGGEDSPWVKWWSPQLIPGGETEPAHIVMRLMLLLLGLGIWAPLWATVAASGFVFACTRKSFDPDCPTQCVAILMLVLAYTPCDQSYSVSAWLRQKFPQTRAVLGGVEPGSIWAKSLMRLHMSLMYFCAATFKIQPYWLNTDGGTLYKEVHIFDLGPLRDVWHLVLSSEGSMRFVAHVMGLSVIVVEIAVAFGFWSKTWHLHFLGIAAAMHLTMSILCGQLGGFTQACWLGLMGASSDARFEKALAEPKNFAIVCLGGIALFAGMGDAFELSNPPV